MLAQNLRDTRRLSWTTPECAVCEFPVFWFDPQDMHEAIITRGDVQGLSFEYLKRIMVRENCVIVHRKDCHIKATKTEEKIHVAQQLIRYEGEERLISFVNSFTDVLPSSMITERLYIISKAKEQFDEIQQQQVQKIIP